MKHQIKQCNQEFQIQITHKNGTEKKKLKKFPYSRHLKKSHL